MRIDAQCEKDPVINQDLVLSKCKHNMPFHLHPTADWLELFTLGNTIKMAQ